IASFPTTIEPMRSLVDRVKALEGKDKVLSISICHGFPYGDVAEAGARILVITDDAKPHGDRLAETIGRELIGLRDKAAPPFHDGEGARLPFRFGGKSALSSGPPVDAEVEIVRCVRNAHQTFAGAPVPLGDAASIRMGGVEAVLISNRAQAMGIDLFANLGI